MAAEKHALLSASSADRWLHCPPSAKLSESLPDTTSDYAEEGRLAHAIAELRLSKTYTKPMGPKKFAAALDKFKEHTRYKEEMDRHIDTYADYVNGVVLGFEARPYVAIEVQVDFSDYVPEGFGTADCIVIGDSALHVIDLKYGQGVPVSPEQNPQMLLYALGAATKYGMFYPIEHVVMTICQPRLDSTLSWAINVSDLLAWGDSIKAVAELAYTGGGAYVPGDWCRFCKAKARCGTRTDPTRLDAGQPQLVGNAEVARRIEAIRPYVAILKDLEDFALSECLDGRTVPGFKAVEGTSNRAWTDQEKAFKVAIEAGYAEALLYERKPITLASAEKVLGKKAFGDTLADYVLKPPGKPTLVSESDKRPAITGRSTVEDDFKEEI